MQMLHLIKLQYICTYRVYVGPNVISTVLSLLSHYIIYVHHRIFISCTYDYVNTKFKIELIYIHIVMYVQYSWKMLRASISEEFKVLLNLKSISFICCE